MGILTLCRISRGSDHQDKHDQVTVPGARRAVVSYGKRQSSYLRDAYVGSISLCIDEAHDEVHALNNSLAGENRPWSFAQMIAR